MSDLEKAAWQALDALENLGRHTSERECDEALAALRAALAQQAEPVVDVVLAEREACAQLCDRFANRMMSAEECADAIRARGQQAEPVPIPGAIPMSQVAARSRAMPERAAALEAARSQQAEPVADRLTTSGSQVYKEQAEPVVDAVLAEREACMDLCVPYINSLNERVSLAALNICDAIRARRQQAEPHKPATDAADGQFMSQADNGNASF